MKNELDKRIREALENLDVPYQAEHWLKLDSRLNDLEPPLPEAIDAVAVDRLADMDVPYEDASWHQFEAKMELAEAAEVDEVAFEKLHPLETPYNSGHWLLMKERLDDAFSWRRKLVRYKVAEVVLMLLLLFTLIQHLPLQKKKIPADRPAVAGPASPQQAANAASEVATADLAGSRSSLLSETTQSDRNATDAPATAVAANSSLDQRQGLPPTGQNARPTVLAALPAPPLSGRSIQNAPQLSASAGKLESTEAMPSPIAMLAFDRIDPVFPGSLHSMSEGAMALALSTPAIRNKRSLRVGMFGSMDYNYIQTPFDEVFDIGPYAVDSTSFSGGITVALRFGRWEVETGGIYSNKSYRPRVPVQQFGTFDYLVIQSFEGIHLDVLEVPLTLRRSFLNNLPKWDVYVSGGISTNLIIKPIYEIRQTEVVAAASVKPPPSEELVEEVNEKSKLNRKDFPAGILHGGAFVDNSYFTASLGVGVERMVNYRWSLFFQPTYQYQFPFRGFGPNDDRFHTLSFRLGTRVIVW